MFDFEVERNGAAAALSSAGFVEVIPENRRSRPIQTAWYWSHWANRTVSATVIGTVVQTVSPGMGNRKQTAPCLQLTVEVATPEPIGCGISLPYGRSAPASMSDMMGPDHPASRLPEGVLRTFFRLIQPDVAESGFLSTPSGRRLRITDRTTLDGYFPNGLHSSAQVLVIHDIGLNGALSGDELRRGLDIASWMAWSLETSQEMPG